MAHEYKWPPPIIRKLPLAEVLCYQAIILDRYQVDTGVPSFVERDLLTALKF